MDSDDDADANGGEGSVEEHEDSDNEEEEESESVGESESGSSEEEEESESVGESESGSSEEEEDESWNKKAVKLIRRLQANDDTLSHVVVWAHTRDVLRQVCAAVQENSNITRFSIYGRSGIINNLNAASVITRALARMPRLLHFGILECTNIDFEALEMLANFLSNKGSIRSMRWCGCNLGDRGAHAIAACFSGNAEIQEINLPVNNISDDGAIAIASLIESNGSITSVNLSCNTFGAEGARRLVHAIVQNQRLEELFMENNSQACADAVANAFETAIYNDESIETIISRSNHTIKRLYYSHDVTEWIDLHRDGPERARRTKIIRFLNEQPTSLLSANLDVTLMPSVLYKIGRDCILNTMFELVRNMPDLFRNLRTQPNQQC